MKNLRTQKEMIKDWIGDTEKPLVSIQCLAYNHERYIDEAIEGFLIQKTNFPFEIIIHDDASTDGTTKIIKEYEKLYPKIIKPIYQRENKFQSGQKKEIKDAISNQIKGEYIALCEGDDYWTDPSKLQKQVDFLEEHMEYSLCYTAATVIDEKGAILQKNKGFGDFNKDELISGHGGAIIGSTMFRTFSMNDYSKHNVMNGDNLLWHSLGFYGKCKQLKNIKNTVYRIHDGGIWSGRSEQSKLVESIKTYSVIRNNIILNFGDDTYLLNKHNQIYNILFIEYFSRNLLRLNMKNFNFGLLKLKEKEYLNRNLILITVPKYILRQFSVFVYTALRLDKLKRLLKGIR